MEQIAMPQLGETVTEGTILRWLKQPGDRVEVDDGLFEVSTEKVDTEVPSAYAGYLREVLVPEGDTVPIGTPLAIITANADDPIEKVPEPVVEPRSGPSDRPKPKAGKAPRNVAPKPRPNNAASGFLSPAVRGLLEDYQLDPNAVHGSGRDGRITRNDVLAAAANPASGQFAQPTAVDSDRQPLPPVTPSDDDDVVEFTRARRNTASNMLRSVATSVHTLVVTEVDHHQLNPVRRGAGLSYLPFIARAVVDAIAEFPHVNASVGDGELIVHRRVNLGIAVDVEMEALVVPVVHDAGGKRLAALADEFADLANRARNRRLGVDDMTGGTFTITNVGAYGTLVTAPIINQPQVAILSTDAIKMRPVAVKLEDESWGIAVHPIGSLCLSFDHRAVDGAYASAFLAKVRDILETRDWSQELGQ